MEKINTYIVQEKIQLWIYSDKQMIRQYAYDTDKIEIAIETVKEVKRFETTYADLLKIFENADTNLSQSRQTKF